MLEDEVIVTIKMPSSHIGVPVDSMICTLCKKSTLANLYINIRDNIYYKSKVVLLEEGPHLVFNYFDEIDTTYLFSSIHTGQRWSVNRSSYANSWFLRRIT